MYQVFQDNLPADCFSYSNIGKDWNNSKFNTFREAVSYAILWAFPYTLSDITVEVLNYYEDLFKKKDNKLNMSMAGDTFPVIMEIREIPS